MNRREFLTQTRAARNQQLRHEAGFVLALTLAATLWVVGVVLIAGWVA